MALLSTIIYYNKGNVISSLFFTWTQLNNIIKNLLKKNNETYKINNIILFRIVNYSKLDNKIINFSII